jgi:hypothetical protein
VPESRGFRIVDLMVLVVLTGMVAWIVREPRLHANVVAIPEILRTPGLRTDATRWLSPIAITAAIVTLSWFSLGSRLTIGRKRVFFQGAAFGGWFFFLLAFVPGVSRTFTDGFAAIGNPTSYELTSRLTCFFQGLPASSACNMLG